MVNSSEHTQRTVPFNFCNTIQDKAKVRKACKACQVRRRVSTVQVKI